MKFSWEVILNKGTETVKSFNSRAKVHEGWLVKDVYWDDKRGHYKKDIVFVPDKYHSWSIEE